MDGILHTGMLYMQGVHIYNTNNERMRGGVEFDSLSVCQIAGRKCCLSLELGHETKM